MKNRLTKVLLSLLCVVLLVAVVAQPAQAACEHTYRNNACTACGQIGGICGIDATWNYDPDSCTLEILGSGAMINYSLDSPAPWSIYKDQIKTIKIADEITNIGAYAFYGCKLVKTITVPMEATSVYSTAFYECTSLRWIEVAFGNETFGYDEYGVLYNKSKTTIYVLPANYTGEYELPKKLSSVASGAFDGTPGLTAIRVHEENKKYVSDENGFLFNIDMTKLVAVPRGYKGDCFIPATVESLSTTALANCPGLTGIYVEEGNENYSSTEDGVLMNADGTKILLCPSGYEGVCKIPASVTSWDYKNAFDKCTGVTGFQVEEGSESFSHDENGYLYNLAKTQLMKVPVTLEGTCHIAATVTSLQTYAVLDSYGITAYEVAEDSQKYSNDEHGVLFNKKKTTLVYCPLGFTGSYTVPDTVKTLGADSFYDCAGLTEVILPDTLTTIGNWAFAKCVNLANVEFPTALKKVGNYAFAYCPNQTSATFSDQVTSIGSYAFAYCTSLTTASIPDGFTVLNNGLFRDCTALNEVSFPDSITTIGSYCFYRCYNLENIPIPASLTKIGSHAFTYCENQASADLPDTVTTVGSYAFAYCPGLTSAYIPDGVTELVGVFQACGNLETVRLPESLTTIGDYCVQKCFKLQHVEFPAALETVGFYAFSNCKNQLHANLPDTVTAIGQNAFSYCTSLKTAKLPAGFEVLRSYTFRGCTALETVEIPDSVNVIGSYSFYKCGNLVQADIPDGVTLIEPYAFYYCEKLENIKIPSKLEELGKGAFSHCQQLTTVVIPEGVTEIGGATFQNCSNLTDLTLPDTLTKIGDRAFYECKKLKPFTLPSKLEKIGKFAFWFCELLEELVFPDTLTELGDSAFRYCYGLKKVVIPASVEEITGLTFYSCHNLSDVTLEEGLTVIGDYMFYNCTAMKSIEIPKSVTSIGACAFQSCTGLTELKIPDGIAVLNFMVFEDCENLKTITLPASLQLIGDGAFCNTPVRDVLYNGTPEQWEKIQVNSENEPLEAVTVHYEAGKCDKHEISEVTEAPTCTEQGGTYRVCTCGIRETLSTTDAIGHNYSSAVTKEPTCVEVGVLTYTCANDPAHTYTEDIPLTGHTEQKLPSVAATCTEAGKTEGVKCSLCQEILTAQKEVEPLDHTGGKATCIAQAECTSCQTAYGQVDPDNHTGKEVRDAFAATCGGEGYSGDTYCSGCGEKLSSGKTVPATGEHDYDTQVVEPTATKKGYTVYTCKACGYSYEDDYTNPVALSAPVIRAVASASGKPTITWDPMEEGIEFEIYRATSKNGEYEELGMTGENSFEDTSAKMGKTYYYKVRAIYGNKSSSSSNAVKAKCKCGQPALKVTNTASSGKVKLKWDKVKSAKKYEVYRASSENGSYKKIKSTTKTYYTDSSAKLGKTYYYKVKAIGSKSSYNSDYSQILQAMRICAQPDLEVKISSSSGKPKLSWDKVSGAKEYQVFRSETKDGEYTLIKTTTSTSYTDKSADFDKDYWYRVTVVGSKSGTDSKPESPVDVHTTCAKPSVSVKLSSKKPKLSWKPVEGATKYYVYRATSKSGKYKKVATVTDATSYRDKSAKKGKTYYYKVKAIAANSEANSAYSSVDKIKSK